MESLITRMCDVCSSSRCSRASSTRTRRCTWTSYTVEQRRVPRPVRIAAAMRSVFNTRFCRRTYARSLSPGPTLVVGSSGSAPETIESLSRGEGTEREAEGGAGVRTRRVWEEKREKRGQQRESGCGDRGRRVGGVMREMRWWRTYDGIE
eukprot:scaffold145375_cov29-Tisochrysis_lutea.AAC.1